MSKTFDFEAGFVSVDKQEKGAEFEVLNDAGDKTGFFITLAGPDSLRRKETKDRLTEYFVAIQKSALIEAQTKNRKQRRAEAAGASVKPSGPSLHDLQLEDAVAGTISWRYPEGFAGPECTPENVRSIYAKHPTLFEQVLEAADNLDLFSRR